MDTSIDTRTAIPSIATSAQTQNKFRLLSSETLTATASWALAGWAGFVFLSSLPYKFSNHPVTENIFTTIGSWISSTINEPLGVAFSNVGGVAVGSVELLTAMVLLLLPILMWAYGAVVKRKMYPSRSAFHAVGGLLAAAVMSGAVFFHLYTPLGIQVVTDGVSDGGSLFRTAVSVLIAGVVLFGINAHSALKR